MFRTIVQPHLDERHLTYQALETEYAGHAEELVMSTKDLAQRYSGIVIISGDGLIHEVYNGLAKALAFCFSQLAIQFWHSRRS